MDAAQRSFDLPGVDNVSIHGVICGSGSPVLLLHGYPETHLMWRHIIPTLAEEHTVVACDMRGYGDSDKPYGAPDHSSYSKRTMAHDMVLVMKQLGFDRFSVVGHDRGGRVAYRMALDHPDAVDKLVLLDIVPTGDMFAHPSPELAKAIYHWYFLTQEAPLPDHMIAGAREEYLRIALHINRFDFEANTGAETFSQEVYEEYLRCFDEGTIHGSSEDYRAAEVIDCTLDREDLVAGRKILAPTLLLWGANGLVDRYFEPLTCWEPFCEQATGHTLPCGHFSPEEAPQELLDSLVPFLKD